MTKKKIINVVPFESLGAVSYSPSTVTMALSCIICEILVENRAFFIPPLHSTPVGGVPSDIAIPFGVVGLPDGKKTEDMYNRLDEIPARDRQTDELDRRTDILPQHSPCYAYASRGKNGLPS